MFGGRAASKYHGTGTCFTIGPHGAFVARASLVPGRLRRWAQRRAKSNSRLTAACDSFAEVHGPPALERRANVHVSTDVHGAKAAALRLSVRAGVFQSHQSNGPKRHRIDTLLLPTTPDVSSHCPKAISPIVFMSTNISYLSGVLLHHRPRVGTLNDTRQQTSFMKRKHDL